MSTIHEPTTTAPTIDPAAIEPTTVATEATTDPIRPTGTDALTAESRPEIAASDAAPHEHVAAANVPDVETPTVHEGQLGYKAPGLVKSFRFSKKFFWLSDEAVQPQHLASYHRTEKPELAHHNAAYAAQTGKGLLFFAKRIEDKAQPAGILNLGEATDISKDGATEFSFRLHGQKHSFQAVTKAERDSWVATIESKAADAKASREEVIGSAGYKKHLENLGTPAAVAAVPAATAANPSSKPVFAGLTHDNAHDGTPSGDAVVNVESSTDVAHTRAKSKGRSQSRKRASIFGSLLGKKEEHDEKKAMKQEEKAEEKEMKKEAREEKHSNLNGSAEPAPLDAVAVAERVLGAPVVPAEGSTTVEAADQPTQPISAESGVESSKTVNRENAPKPNKRNSLFSGLFNKKDAGSPTLERTERDVGPTPPLKDTESTLASAPAPQTTEPATKSTVQTAEPSHKSVPDVLESTTAPVAGDAPVQKSSPVSRGGIFGFMKQKEAQYSEKKDLMAEEKAEKQVEQPVLGYGTPTARGSGVPAPSSTAVGEAEPSTIATLPAATTAIPEPAKERRRSSFFGTLGSKKERRAEATSDSEVTDGEGKKVGKLGGLFRMPSRAAQGAKRPSNVAHGNPATVSEAAEASTSKDVTAEPQTSGDLPNAESSSKPVGDAVPSAVTNHHQTAVEASA